MTSVSTKTHINPYTPQGGPRALRLFSVPEMFKKMETGMAGGVTIEAWAEADLSSQGHGQGLAVLNVGAGDSRVTILGWKRAV